MSGWRTIVVDGVSYVWRGADYVTVRFAESRKAVCRGPVTEIIPNMNWNVWERGQHKQTQDGMLTPRHVAAWIRRQVSCRGT